MCGRVRSGALDAERVIVLFSTPADVLRALREGLPSRVVNIGGMHVVPGKRKLMDVLAVDDADVEAFREMSRLGVSVDIQTVPTGKPVPLEKVFKACAVARKL
jgi:PTS system N-acetylgalactosamine-specific IIB component